MNIEQSIRINLLNIMGELLKESSFDKKEPIPIITIFFNNVSGEIYEPIYRNENTIDIDKPFRYLKHGETLAVMSGNFDNLDNLSVFITIPPCTKCYKELSSLTNIESIHWLTHRYGFNKLLKIDKLIDNEDYRDIPRNKFDFNDNEQYHDEYLKYKKEIKLIEKWMKFSN